MHIYIYIYIYIYIRGESREPRTQWHNAVHTEIQRTLVRGCQTARFNIQFASNYCYRYVHFRLDSCACAKKNPGLRLAQHIIGVISACLLYNAVSQNVFKLPVLSFVLLSCIERLKLCQTHEKPSGICESHKVRLIIRQNKKCSDRFGYNNRSDVKQCCVRELILTALQEVHNLTHKLAAKSSNVATFLIGQVSFLPQHV